MSVGVIMRIKRDNKCKKCIKMLPELYVSVKAILLIQAFCRWGLPQSRMLARAPGQQTKRVCTSELWSGWMVDPFLKRMKETNERGTFRGFTSLCPVSDFFLITDASECLWVSSYFQFALVILYTTHGVDVVFCSFRLPLGLCVNMTRSTESTFQVNSRALRLW